MCWIWEQEKKQDNIYRQQNHEAINCQTHVDLIHIFEKKWEEYLYLIPPLLQISLIHVCNVVSNVQYWFILIKRKSKNKNHINNINITLFTWKRERLHLFPVPHENHVLIPYFKLVCVWTVWRAGGLTDWKCNKKNCSIWWPKEGSKDLCNQHHQTPTVK